MQVPRRKHWVTATIAEIPITIQVLWILVISSGF